MVKLVIIFLAWSPTNDHSIIATISLPVATNCRGVLLSKANLIEETCKQKLHQNLCIQYLSSDPRNADVDIATTRKNFMINVIKTKANNALDKIQQLLQGSHEHSQKEALSSCAGRYKTILEADVAQAIAALQKGDPKFAEDYRIVFTTSVL
ncbi:cell wall / vacuolar inhibitor of fructosidase 1-like [Vigna radiata var. radiata]|uniref:Cell wall / vacuolar inhibitor of fructosidase 1-like n=1 Tax=Vigna radiata var. radiata TaxID=3916 RepID=A0A1S3U050_VIGRR|nr:cell wall / vacuolar inhibitor of fructosidase 1-like [Vigna radiata var. radiata]